MNTAAKNTDRELWVENPGDYYSDRLFVTEGGGIGIDVGGSCIVKPLKAWHALACPKLQYDKDKRTISPMTSEQELVEDVASELRKLPCRCSNDPELDELRSREAARAIIPLIAAREREECLALCEKQAEIARASFGDGYYQGSTELGALRCRDAIRSRKGEGA